VRRIDVGTGRIRTMAGNGTAGSTGDYGSWHAAQLNQPYALTFDPAGNLYIADSSNCAIRYVQGAGDSTPLAAQLAVFTGDGQATALDQDAPAQFGAKLTDENGQPLANYKISWTAVEASGYVHSGSSTTSAQGVASTLGRVGLAPGDYHFAASFKTLGGQDIPGSPVTFTVTAQPPSTGTTFTVLNVDHIAGDDVGPLPATVAHVGDLHGMARASDGTLYVADVTTSRIRVISPSGVLTTLAGTGNGGYAGDGGFASQAQLRNPEGVALDESAGLLYVADTGNHVVRVIALRAIPPTISPFAGVNSASAPLNDNGPATSAGLNAPRHLALHTDSGVSYLYVTDSLHNAIRRINLASDVISSWFTLTTVQGGSGRVTWDDCGGTGCVVTWDPNGLPVISGHYFGGVFYNPQGIVRWDPNNNPGLGGTLTELLGETGSGAPTVDGTSATNTQLSGPPTGITFDVSGQLVYTDLSDDVVRFIDGAATIHTLAGSYGTAAYAGDNLPLASVRLNQPWTTMFTSEGHILIEDAHNGAIRESY
jgi:hypothetical protein